MSQKIFLFSLLIVFSICVHPVYSFDDNFGYESWPGKDGVTRTNIEPPVEPFIKYGTFIKGPIRSQLIRLAIRPEVPVADVNITGGEIKVYVYPSVEEAQSHLLDYFNSFEGYPALDRIMDSSVGDVMFGHVAFGGKYQCYYFTRSNVMVQILYISISYTKAIEELPVIIDSMIKNAPAWKQGDPEPHLIISEEFKTAFSSPSAVKTEGAAAEVPSVFTLSRNAPNPFNPSTAISFSLSRPERVNLTVHDALGREITGLASGNYPAGNHTLTWNGRDARGNAVSSGVYLYRLEAGGKSETRKMLLMR